MRGRYSAGLLSRVNRLVVVAPALLVILGRPAPMEASLKVTSTAPVDSISGRGVCSVRQLSSEPLRIGSRVLYVEPLVMEPNARGDVLLLGRYNYLGEVDSAGHWKPVGADGDLVGAVVRRNGGATAVASPIPSRRLSGLRALRERDGRWSVVFAELIDPGASGAAGDSARTLWSATYDGQRWSRLRRLEAPPGPAFATSTVASLVRRGDTLFWAASRVAGQGLVVFRRQAGRWASAGVPVGHAQAELGSTTRSGLVLAVVGGDPAQNSDYNSLLFWTPSPAWRFLRTVVPGRQEPVYHPDLRIVGEQDMLSWQTPSAVRGGWTIRALPDPDVTPASAALIVDTVTNGWSTVTPLTLANGRALWVTTHMDAPGRDEIQFSVYDPQQGISVAGRFASPYLARFGVTALGNDEFLISGPLYIERRYVVTLLLRYSVHCES